MGALQSIIIWVGCYFVVPYLTFLPPGARTLISLFAPYLVPKLIDFAKSILHPSSRIPVRPVPAPAKRALNLFFASASLALLLTLPNFADENVFTATQSRLQIDTDVLFKRLEALRPLTPTDTALRAKFVNAESRLAYLVYGADTVAHCTICGPDDAWGAFMYHLPKLLLPHLLHAVVLGAATSDVFAGREGARWRKQGWIAALAVVVVEVWYIATYDIARNKKAKRLQDLELVFWRVRTLRLIAISALDGLLALALWLTSTNRWLARPPPVAARVEAATKNVEESLMKMRALGVLRNAVVRDKVLRGEVEEYWRQEGDVMGELVQDPEVAVVMNGVVEGMNMERVETDAGAMADGIMGGLVLGGHVKAE
ncbi:uncharacterized protein BDZ99DRAFT_456206 [Mytilinidion resinicola]|uniref:Chorismate synthase protein n=1 Tax=Mytilinidion resinicola TaxID=574789 RepID=A0A6A6XYF0_9PEZI|nr:uncharacterized protein BDZ99DRAFT_456206 [Mytilinidion resinicola]KAF2801440.1 hypothetical protein BDZ99DRAFT_456206 [Mytilinidion resinicola]